jgi:hypothetical protein
MRPGAVGFLQRQLTGLQVTLYNLAIHRFRPTSSDRKRKTSISQRGFVRGSLEIITATSVASGNMPRGYPTALFAILCQDDRPQECQSSKQGLRHGRRKGGFGCHENSILSSSTPVLTIYSRAETRSPSKLATPGRRPISGVLIPRFFRRSLV